MPKMAASGWRAFPCSRRHLRLDIVLLCGQSFRYAVVQHNRNIAVWNDVVLSLQCAPLVARKGSQKYLQHWRGCFMSEQTIFTCISDTICWVRCTLQHPGIWHKRNGGGLHSGLAALAGCIESSKTVHRDGMNCGVVKMTPVHRCLRKE